MNSPVFGPGPVPNTAKAANGQVVSIPTGWILLPPGDAALTRRVKLAGDHWIVQEKRTPRLLTRHLAAAVHR
jgi:hypothetical protein